MPAVNHFSDDYFSRSLESGPALGTDFKLDLISLAETHSVQGDDVTFFKIEPVLSTTGTGSTVGFTLVVDFVSVANLTFMTGTCTGTSLFPK